jgi:hypothetical protein
VFPHVSEPYELPGLGVYLLRLAVRIGELEVSVRQEDSDSRRVLVHYRSLPAGIFDSYDAHSVIFKFDCVMFGVELDGVALDDRLCRS